MDPAYLNGLLLAHSLLLTTSFHSGLCPIFYTLTLISFLTHALFSAWNILTKFLKGWVPPIWAQMPSSKRSFT